jgi:exodeoxyribonuclease VIII
MAKHVGEGVTLITPDQRDVAFAQAASIRSLPDVAALMGDGQAEVSAYWIDATTGVRCRCRPDWRSPTGKRGKQSILLDMKGYGDVSAREFALQVARMSYARQAAMYSIGYEIASGHPVVGFVFVAVEDRFPFAAAAYMLPEEWLEIGRREYRELLDLYAKCLATNTWPRLQDGIQLLQMPAWVAREAEKV